MNSLLETKVQSKALMHLNKVQFMLLQEVCNLQILCDREDKLQKFFAKSPFCLVLILITRV